MRKAVCSLIVVSLAVLGACGQPPVATTTEEVVDLLFFRSGNGVATFEAGASAPEFSGGGSVTSSDWSTVVETNKLTTMTEVTTLDPRTGAERWTTVVDGKWDAKLLSASGDLVALGPARENPYGFGRKETTLLITGSAMLEPKVITVEGNYEPEAFSTDGQNLFVVSYLPAGNPSKYQVRRLDIAAGEVKAVYTPHEELQRAMGGTARIQTASSDGRRLYTLYTVEGRGSNDSAFIHVLALDELWAHCIDLPPAFAKAADRSSAITISPDDEKLFVANATSDVVAEIDPSALRVVRTADVDLARQGLPQATIDTGSNLYFASGRRLASIDTNSLTVARDWVLAEPIKGLQLGAAGDKLYVGMKREVAVIDTTTGDELETVDPPGVGRIDQLGTGMQHLEEPYVKGPLRCAC